MRARTQSACTGAHLERNDGNVACVSCAVLLVLCCCLGIHACATRPHRRPPTGPHNGCMGRWHHQQSAQQADELNSMDGPTVNSGCHACMRRANPGGAWPYQTGQDFLPNHLVDGIDFASVHMWPDNWDRVRLFSFRGCLSSRKQNACYSPAVHGHASTPEHPQIVRVVVT